MPPSAPSRRPLVTLATDFGTRDGYVAQMKGVLRSEGPEGIEVWDLSHDLARQDVMAAALFAESAYRTFPEGTVHVLVVDPGVGSERRAIVARSRGQFFVGPDNGVFGLCLEPRAPVHEIDLAALGRPIAPTFHGRDVFAPAAARVASGTALRALGKAVPDPVGMTLPLASFERARVTGEVIHVDRFGNCLTNLTKDALAGWARGSALGVIGDRPYGRVREHYAQVDPGEPIALFDSGDRLEIAIREGSAAAELRLSRGARITVQRQL